jgi:hypothetical protein
MQQITLVTSDGKKFEESRWKLQHTFRLIASFMVEFPEAQEMPLALSSNEWLVIHSFVHILIMPSEKKELIALARAANYLEPIGNFQKILLEEFVTKHISCQGLNFLEIARKLELLAFYELSNTTCAYSIKGVKCINRPMAGMDICNKCYCRRAIGFSS